MDPNLYPNDPRFDEPQPEDVKYSLTTGERTAAEETYTRRAFDYEQNPIGSRDWTLFWSGWCARAVQSAQPVSDAYKLEAKTVADDVVRDAKVGAAIERAARELPYGYDIRIEIEREAGTVSLYGPDCEEIRLDFDGDTFAGEINTAVDTALTIHQHDVDAMLAAKTQENAP